MKLIYNDKSGTIRQMPENYLIAHCGGNGWESNPDLAANMDLCVAVYRTINHSHANKYLATGDDIVRLATELYRRTP